MSAGGRRSGSAGAPLLLALLAVALLAACAGLPAGPRERPRALLVVIDGLRSDYITPQLMPNLQRLAEDGVRAVGHHSVYPTLTRVNAATFATGAYPEAHGLMHNTIYLPAVSGRPISTYEASELVPAAEALDGELLTVASAGEWLERHGRTFFVGSSGSTGSSFILDHRGRSGGVWNARGFVYPDSMAAIAARVMPPFPGSEAPSAEQNRWVTEAYARYALDSLGADLAILWITDPDGTAHRHGPGAPETVAALRRADDALGRVLAALEERGLRDATNVVVTTDHGFSTDVGGYDVAGLLKARGLDGGVRVVGGDQVYVEEGGEERIRRVVEALQADPGVGAIFTRAAAPGDPLGHVAGTLSLELIRYGHPRAADVLVSPAWTADQNGFGYAGTTTRRGAAGHGSSSPFEVQTTLVASGPGFKRRLRSEVPTGNVDVLPTLLHLLGLPPLPSAQGRVMAELLAGEPGPGSVRVGRESHEAAREWPGGRYRVTLETVSAGGAVYVHQAAATR